MSELEDELDKILTTLENLVAIDVTQRVLAHKSGQSPKKSHAGAKKAIRAYVDKKVREAISKELKGLPLIRLGIQIDGEPKDVVLHDRILERVKELNKEQS